MGYTHSYQVVSSTNAFDPIKFGRMQDALSYVASKDNVAYMVINSKRHVSYYPAESGFITIERVR